MAKFAVGWSPRYNSRKWFMDPAPLTNSEWSEISSLLINLWLMVALVIFLATNLLVGHIIIPSLVASHHVSPTLQKTRPVFYLLAIAGFVAVIVVLVSTIDHSGVIADIFETYWIDGGVD